MSIDIISKNWIGLPVDMASVSTTWLDFCRPGKCQGTQNRNDDEFVHLKENVISTEFADLPNGNHLHKYFLKIFKFYTCPRWFWRAGRQKWTGDETAGSGDKKLHPGWCELTVMDFWVLAS